MKKAKAYILEFLVIFLSITVAFLSENWRENLQDKEDYELIIAEIHANLVLDSLEFAIDIGNIDRQIRSIERILDLKNPCPVDSIEYHFGQLMYHFRWPDIKSTGIGQLRNSKTIHPDSELISAVNHYYTWTEYLKGSTPYQYIIPQNDFNEWLLQNDLVNINENLQHTDPIKYKQLRQRLLHLKRNKKLQMGSYKVGLSKITLLLQLYEDRS